MQALSLPAFSLGPHNHHRDGLSAVLLEPCSCSLSSTWILLYLWHRGLYTVIDVTFKCESFWLREAILINAQWCPKSRQVVHYNYWYNHCEIEMELYIRFIFWVPFYFRFTVTLTVCLGIFKKSPSQIFNFRNYFADSNKPCFCS